MNVEELKQLKKELISEFKYVIAPQLICAEENEVSEVKTKEEILKEVNTDEFIKQCEQISEDTIRFLLNKGINIDTITLPIENCGIVCSKLLYERLSDLDKKWKKKYDTRNQITKEWTSTFKQGLKSQILPEIVPIQIFPIIDYDNLIPMKEIEEFEENHRINGLVNFEQFVLKMKTLGFNFTKSLNTYDDYINALHKQGDTDICLSISADLQLENEKPKTKSYTR